MLLTVDLGKTTLGVAFEHPRVTENNGTQKPIATRCQLYGIRNGGEPLRIAEGKATCSHLDNFRKSVGRKIALTRALKKLTTLTKDERAKVWAAYLNRLQSVPKTEMPQADTTVVGTGTVNA